MRSTYQHALDFVKSKAIGSEYLTFKMDNEEDELVSIMGFVEKLYPNSVILVCQRSPDPTVQYVSSTCRKVFGVETNTVMKMTLPDFLDLIHPEDVNDVDLCYSFINSTEPYDPAIYRFELFYRLKHKRRNYVNICEVKMAIENSQGKFIYLNLYRDVSFEAKFHDVRLNIYKRIQEDYKKINTYNPRREPDVFTPRQNEIANLIGRGFTNEEIANQLHVSISTVKNHKNRLFKKARVKSSIELASFVHQLHSVQ
jgi:DNA-binding CsgD family transcriptional regulator